MRKNRLLSLFMFAALPVGAQQSDDLTLTQAGRLAVAQCYSQCVEIKRANEIAIYENTDRLNEAQAYSVAERLTGIDHEQNYRTRICNLKRDGFLVVHACHLGCADIEAVYGISATSNVKTAFDFVYQQDKQELVDAGFISALVLPTGTPFETACNALFGITTEESDVEQPLAPVIGGPRVDD